LQLILHKKIAFLGAPLICLYIFFVYIYSNHAVDIYPIRYSSSFSDGIDFSKDGYPHFVSKVSGLSAREDWGRWTNQYRGDVILTFSQELPRNFDIELNAVAYGRNANSPTTIKVGDQERQLTISSNSLDNYLLSFRDTKGVHVIKIIPPAPISPAEINPVSKDGRKLGIGLQSLKILPN
jgi:phosphoglycerol transferase